MLTLDEILVHIQTDLKLIDIDIIETLSQENEFLKSIIEYIVLTGGKKLRPSIVFLIAKNLRENISEPIKNLASAIELVHTATLVHDDVVDNTSYRRNKQTINSLFDEKTAVLAGDYLLAQALIKISQMNNSEIIGLFAMAMKEICSGEISQNQQKGSLISLEEYIGKSKRKTALLYSVAAKSCAILSGANQEIIDEMGNFGINFGIGFQILDDLKNFQKNDNKPVLNDIKSGIITAPVIFLAEKYPELNKEKFSDKDIEFILEKINNKDIYEKTKELAGKYLKKSLDNLEILKNDVNKNSLISLVSFVSAI